MLGEVFRTGRPHAGRGVRVLLRRESGQEERFLDFVYQPMFDADGKVSGIFVHGVDVTDHKRAEARARASEERYRTLFSSIDEGFCVAEVLFDASGRGIDHRIIEVNPAFEKLTGIPVEAVLSGKTVRELVPNIERHWSETYGRALTTGEPERFVSGSEALGRWFDVYVFRVGCAEERKVAILFNNITDRRLADWRGAPTTSSPSSRTTAGVSTWMRSRRRRPGGASWDCSGCANARGCSAGRSTSSLRRASGRASSCASPS